MRAANAVSALLCPLAPGLALAEGAVQVLDCQAVQTCNATGDCAPGGTDTKFEISPVDVGENGKGQYQIAYAGRQFDMTNVTGLGPMVWSEGGNEVQSLLPSGAQELIWHQLQPSAPISARTVFMTCQGAG